MMSAKKIPTHNARKLKFATDEVGRMVQKRAESQSINNLCYAAIFSICITSSLERKKLYTVCSVVTNLYSQKIYIYIHKT